MINSTCPNCGAEMEPGSKRCPECRSYIVRCETGSLTITAFPVTIIATDPWDVLLKTAELLIDNARSLGSQPHNKVFFAAAVVVAHTACEVITERVICQAIVTQKLEHLEDSLTSSILSYSMKNEKVQKLYKALTGDTAYNTQPFWQDFKPSARRRDAVAHTGEHVSEQDALQSLQVACDFVVYMETKHNLK